MRTREVIDTIQCPFRRNGKRDTRYGSEFHATSTLGRPLHTAFAALLSRAGVSQAGFSPRQVNNWCRGRAAVPPWAAVLAAILDERAPDAPR
jgi:transcriptional regulator with XRE-family HTH domain